MIILREKVHSSSSHNDYSYEEEVVFLPWQVSWDMIGKDKTMYIPTEFTLTLAEGQFLWCTSVKLEDIEGWWGGMFAHLGSNYKLVIVTAWTQIMGSNPIQVTDVCPHFSVLCYFVIIWVFGKPTDNSAVRPRLVVGLSACYCYSSSSESN